MSDGSSALARMCCAGPAAVGYTPVGSANLDGAQTGAAP